MLPFQPLEFSVPTAPGAPVVRVSWDEISRALDDEGVADVLRRRVRQVASLGRDGHQVTARRSVAAEILDR
jgi:hypothetical protein